MVQLLKKAAYKNGYLLITAAWLYTLSFLFVNYWSYTSSPERVRQVLEEQIARHETFFQNTVADTLLLQQLLPEKPTPAKTRIQQAGTGLFIYEINSAGRYTLVYWNTNLMQPETATLQQPDGSLVTYQNGYFELLKQTVQLRGRSYLVAGLVPLHWNYFAELKYLKSAFDGFPEIDEQYGISTSQGVAFITNGKGAILFYLVKKEQAEVKAPNLFFVILRILAVVFLVVFVYSVAFSLADAGRFYQALFLFGGVLFLLRMASYVIIFPFDFRVFALFNTQVYHAGFINSSLGDLLINEALLLWLVLFYKANYRKAYGLIRSADKQLFAQLCVALIPLVTFATVNIIAGLVVHSSISFDVTNFFSISIFSVASFVVVSLLFLIYYHVSHLLIMPAFTWHVPLTRQLLIVLVAGLVFLTILLGVLRSTIYIFSLAWLLFYLTLLNKRRQDIYTSLPSSPFFLFWVLIFAGSVAAVIIFCNQQVVFANEKKNIEKIQLQNSPSGELLVNMGISNFNSPFIDSSYLRFYNAADNHFLKDSLVSTVYKGYHNQYETHVFTYDKQLRPLHNEDSTAYNIIRAVIDNKGKPTSVAGLYYYEDAPDRFSYLFEKRIRHADSTIGGYLFVLTQPRNYKSEALSPELFKESSDVASALNANYAYALYRNNNLVKTFGYYDFAVRLPEKPMTGEYAEKQVNGYNELWYNAGNNTLIVLARKDALFLESVTLFAYLFCTCLLIVVLLHFANFVLRARFRYSNIRRLLNFNIRTRIYSTIIFINLFSFIVIGVSTISFFIIRYRNTNKEKLTKAIQLMATEIQDSLKARPSADSALQSFSSNLGNIDKKLSELAGASNVDVNFYDVDGTLLLSTQPYIYNKKILSNKMNADAFLKMHSDNRLQYLQEEKIGEFVYQSIYAPVRDNAGRTRAYLNIPYLNSQNELKQEISTFLVTLINLNALIFVLAGAIALLLTNKITDTFNLIGDKMKRLGLGQENEEIEWNNRDEIGALVTEYNKMVRKLDESARALARSEREGAWQEMARQVAHEIKNPLTPMKLSIQYLQRAIVQKADNVAALTERVADTLIRQIDQLTLIANDFSQFANINNSHTETFDLHEVLQNVVQLHSMNTTVTLTWDKVATSPYVAADKAQLNRMFTNLLKNAIEATREGEKPEIHISEQVQDGHITIGIADNGTGIGDEMRHKIFIPNFTTKSSGTGLGLAICKGIVEKANGSIRFETEQGKGTTFLVELPLVQSNPESSSGMTTS